jgi:hypothetical protein
VDKELKQLDLATAETRRLATEALEALRAPQVTLRQAAADYIGSMAKRRLDASRHASVEVMAKFGDADVAELRLWAEDQTSLASGRVEREIASCDFWIPETPGLSPTDVTSYSIALMPKPKDTRTGIPQVLVLLFEACLAPLRRGLAAIDLAVIPAEAEPRVEVTLIRAWRAYREAAIACVTRWADVDEHYHASADRFQEMRWELAGEVDADTIKARRKADDSEVSEESVAAHASAAAEAPPDAIVRADSESLIPVPG